MKLFFITIFRKTFLWMITLVIITHIVYPYLYDFPYLFAIKIVVLLICLVEMVGLFLDRQYPKLYPQEKLPKMKSSIQSTYRSIEVFFYYSSFVYVYLPKEYLFPNYCMMLIFGVFLGCKVAIKAEQYFKMNQ